MLEGLTSDPSVMTALLEGFRKNTSLHYLNIEEGCIAKIGRSKSFSSWKETNSVVCSKTRIQTIAHRLVSGLVPWAVQRRGLTFSSTCLPPKQD
jgi:hypothetical protein